MQPTGTYAADLDLAMRIADDVDAFTLPASTGDLVVEMKPDDTPVTAIDREAEQIVRAWVSRERPDDAFYGEEYGVTEGGSRRWVVDPIDGTKNFIKGVPVWATLIALFDGDEPVMGVVSAPALGRRWFAAAGDGAWRGQSLDDAVRISVSDTDDLAEASMSYSSLHGWEEHDMLPAFLDLMGAMWRTRAYGDFWSYMMVAEGAVDVAMEPELALYDMAALVPIVREAGGEFSSTDGEPGCSGGNAVASNGLLHQELLTRLHA